MVSAGGQSFDQVAGEEERRRRRRNEGGDGGDWSDCLPDDCVPDCLPDSCTPDCTPDCVPCDLNLMLIGLIALSRPGHAPRSRPTGPARAGRLAIRGYQRWLSHRLPTRCRHTPTCSAYGFTAVTRYGLITGSRLTAGRLQRCKSPTPYGTVDPVP